MSENKKTPTTKALATKILKIMEELTYLKKDGSNTFHKYNYVTEAKISKAFRDKFIEHKIILVPSARLNGTENGITNLDMTMAIIDIESGEKIEVPWAGQGADKGDKGMYKAFTGGIKYFLMKLFMLPTGDDPEVDNPDYDKSSTSNSKITYKGVRA